ncbi:TetR/AcrR family transcriptional regulator [uncultured Tistrella sp.]|uniref:TetR/AcrR family transcriptional regulator n=1 Tax=Tistrella mobilis TaxID=171437 RepID=UPI000C08E14C|nr:TetR/AcrR family transcriptional regulator [uncultured Tistrella sp.]MAM73796.1 TetR family transcriptional regulator [Tistrella sp.]
MARRRSLPDDRILEITLALMHRLGPQAVTFAAVAAETGLSGATLVQRFGSKPAMIRAALDLAWTRLETATAEAIAACPPTPEGAVALLAGLSQGYGDIDSYADGLMVLREDLRDPELRARGTRWGNGLAAAIDRCFPGQPDAGRLMITQWQGALIWWGFAPDRPIDRVVAEELGSLAGLLAGRPVPAEPAAGG